MYDFIQSRITPPEFFENTVIRLDLMKQLNSYDNNVIYVQAGSGYGKTYLLSTFASINENTAWYTADEFDNDLFIFSNYVNKAIEKVVPEYLFEDDIYDQLRGKSNIILKLATIFIDRILSVRKQINIIIDNFQNITEISIIKFLGIIIRNMPQNFKIIFASRTSMPIEYSKYKIARNIVEITQEDMKFSKEEATQILMRFDMNIYEQTEGWAAGLSVYRSFLEKNETRGIDDRYQENQHTQLMNDVFEKISEDIKKFMLYTSYLRKLEPKVCDYLLGIDNSKEILKNLSEQNMFTLRFSENEYRYHKMFKNFLNTKIIDYEKDIKNKIIKYYIMLGQYREASKYAMDIDDVYNLEICIKEEGEKLFYQDYFEIIDQYFLYGEKRGIEPGLYFCYIKSRYLSRLGKYIESEYWIEKSIKYFEENSKDKYYVYVMVQKACIYRNMNSFEMAIETIDSLKSFMESLSMEEKYMVLIEKIICLLWLYRYEEAVKITKEMVRECKIRGNIKISLWFERCLIMSLFYLGKYKYCTYLYEKTKYANEVYLGFLKEHTVTPYIAHSYYSLGNSKTAYKVLKEEIDLQKKYKIIDQLWISYAYKELLLCNEWLASSGEEANNIFKMLKENICLLKENTLGQNKTYIQLVEIFDELLTFFEGYNGTIDFNKAKAIVGKAKSIVPFVYMLTLAKVIEFLVVKDKIKEANEIIDTYEDNLENTFSNLPEYVLGPVLCVKIKDGNYKNIYVYIKFFMEKCAEQNQIAIFKNIKVYTSILKFAWVNNINRYYIEKILKCINFDTNRIFVKLLGKFEFADFNERKLPLKWRTSKTKELFSFLIIRNECKITKKEIIKAMWGDLSLKKGNEIFNTTVYNMRKALKKIDLDDFFTYKEGCYVIKRKKIICDADAFLTNKFFAFDKTPSIENALEVINYYNGKFMEGYESEWIEEPRKLIDDKLLKAYKFIYDKYSEGNELLKIEYIKERLMLINPDLRGL